MIHSYRPRTATKLNDKTSLRHFRCNQSAIRIIYTSARRHGGFMRNNGIPKKEILL